MLTLERLRAIFYEYDGVLYNWCTRGKARAHAEAGYIAEDGYRRVCIDKKYYYIHRIVWWMSTGKEVPDDLFIDHIDGNRLNNKIENLRLASALENQYNKARQVNGTSQYKGVWFDAVKNCWKASIRTNDGNRHYIGQFVTELEAAVAYDKLAIQIQGEFAKLNVLDSIAATKQCEHNKSQ